MKHLPAVAAAATGVQVGAAIVASRFVIDQTGPASLALLRYLIGLCCLAPVVLLSARGRFARRDLAPIALLGIVQFGVLVALLNHGLRTVPAACAALIFAPFPLLTMLLASVIGQERLSPAETAGVLLTVVGVGLAFGDGAVRGRGVGVGEAAVFGSALCGAVCSVLYRPYLRCYPALPVGTVAMLAAVGFLAVPAAGEGFFASFPPRFTGGGWLAVLVIGAGSGAGYVLWLWALGRTTATRVTVFLALSPVTATLLGAALLGVRVSAALLGLAGVAAGLWLTNEGA